MTTKPQHTPNEQRAIDQFTAKVEAQAERSGCSRRTAVAIVSQREPELHRQYLKATNPATIAQDL